MSRLLSSRWSIVLGVLLAVYGIAGTSSLIWQDFGTKNDFLRFRGQIYTADFQTTASESIPNEELRTTSPSDLRAIAPADPVAAALVSEFEESPPASPAAADNPNEPVRGAVIARPCVLCMDEAIPSEADAGDQAGSSSIHPLFPEIPVRIAISSVELNAPVVVAETKVVKVGGKEYQQWLAPDRYASGWHPDSARLGEEGNTILNGHHNIDGEVFRNLVDVEVGALIQVFSTDSIYTYQVTNKMILPEKYEQIDVRMNNAQWILPSQDERLTLITCWPYESNTHRLIVVAKPLAIESRFR